MLISKSITCLVCGRKFELESDLDIGDIVVCTRCDANLKIVSCQPLELEIFSINLDNKTLISQNIKKGKVRDGKGKEK